MNSLENKWNCYIDVPVIQRQQVLEVPVGYAEENLTGKSRQLTFGYLDNYRAHAELLAGTWPEEAANSTNEMVQEALKEGAIPVVVSQKTYDTEDLTIGQHWSAVVKKDEEKIHVEAIICGIIEEVDDGDPFWDRRLRTFDRVLFASKEDFSTILDIYSQSQINYTERVMFDYTYINYNNAEEYLSYLRQFRAIDSDLTSNFENILSSYVESKKTISIILFTFFLASLCAHSFGKDKFESPNHQLSHLYDFEPNSRDGDRRNRNA